RSDVTIIEPHYVEDVIGAGSVPGDLAVEDQVLHRQLCDRLSNGRDVLRQPIPRVKPHLRALLERDETYAIKLTLEDPFGAGEPIWGRCRGHGFEPLWEGCGHTSGVYPKASSPVEARSTQAPTQPPRARRGADGPRDHGVLPCRALPDDTRRSSR